MLLRVEGLSKEFADRTLFSGLSFHLAAGERVGIVGDNGCGKSTLLKILMGELPADGGRCHFAPRLSRAYLAQDRQWAEERRLGEQLGKVAPALLRECGVTRTMLAQPAGELSGGQRTRAGLARALAGRPDLLLLDEPTNHLDTEGLQWLESTLIAYPGSLLVVSHDRLFLDRVVSRILELKDGKLREYRGNWSAYASQKQAERERAEAEYRKARLEQKRLKEAIRRQTAWAEAVHNAPVLRTEHPMAKDYHRRQAKAHTQVAKALEKRLERIDAEKPRDSARVNLQLTTGERLGRNLLQAQGLGFSYDGERWLFRQADFYVQRGDRIALIGPNGAGKTTLIRLLLGQIEPGEGRLHRPSARVAYVPQRPGSDPGDVGHPDQTVLEAATGNAADHQPEARTLLGCLLFSGADVQKRVGLLSGGEKVRLALAKILLAQPDLLILDEPTNGLDLASRERVEEALDGYPGTLVMVSHDRYLLRRLATRLLIIEEGQIARWEGDYESYEKRRSPAEPSGEAEQILLLETRLAQLSAALAAPPPGEGERLNQEFIRVSRELRGLKERRQ